MIIAIGSRAESKIGAVGRAFAKHSNLWLNDNKLEYLILPKDFRQEEANSKSDKISGVSTNPLTLEETLVGAKTRAKVTYEYFKSQDILCNYSIGIEAGNFKMEDIYYMITIAVIFDGENYFIGLSPSFAMPNVIMDKILTGTECGHLGEIFGTETLKGRKGIINQLTKERVNREDFEEPAIGMALAQIVSLDIYNK